MNRLRNMRRRSALSCWVLRFFLLVLAFRLLLPSGLMPGAVAPEQGLTLVLCSGHGELVLPASATGAVSLASVEASVATVHDIDAHTASSSGWTLQHTSPDVMCAYSAVFAQVIQLAILLLLVSHLLSRPAAPLSRRREPLRVWFVHSRQLARAPPSVIAI
ncbi:hypothetical protein [Paraburkholderia bannensis]|uniref:hypothetical protein n=1 Tax=Paraburkholderia bannensis TaxID=765414 RepID=UPI0004866BA5|nr:hypothetical protein [Paraburkholderia bannensis]